MKLQQVRRIVRQVWDIFHSTLGSAEVRDLDEYEKVKKEFKPLNPSKSKKSEKVQNRDISAI